MVSLAPGWSGVWGRGRRRGAKLGESHGTCVLNSWNRALGAEKTFRKSSWIEFRW